MQYETIFFYQIFISIQPLIIISILVDYYNFRNFLKLHIKRVDIFEESGVFKNQLLVLRPNYKH